MPRQRSTNMNKSTDAKIQNQKNMKRHRELADLLVQKKYEKSNMPCAIKTEPVKEELNKFEEMPDFYMKRSKIEGCECETDSLKKKKDRYNDLDKIKKCLCKKMEEIDEEMADIVEKLRDKCKTEEKMNSTSYESEFCKGQLQPHGEPWLEGYKKRSPNFGRGYRDQNHFRYTKSDRPRVQPETPVNFAILPPSDPIWHQRFGGDSEYAATISAMGPRNMRNVQVYLMERFSRKCPPESHRKRRPPIIV